MPLNGKTVLLQASLSGTAKTTGQFSVQRQPNGWRLLNCEITTVRGLLCYLYWMCVPQLSLIDSNPPPHCRHITSIWFTCCGHVSEGLHTNCNERRKTGNCSEGSVECTMQHNCQRRHWFCVSNSDQRHAWNTLAQTHVSKNDVMLVCCCSFLIGLLSWIPLSTSLRPQSDTSW